MKRFSRDGYIMSERTDGDYILFTDHEEEVKRLIKERDGWMVGCMDERQENEQLKEDIQRAVQEEREAAKKLAIEFFYWWHNQPGTNTAQGYDEFIRQMGVECKDSPGRDLKR